MQSAWCITERASGGREGAKINPPFRVGAAELGNWNASSFPDNDPSLIRNFSGAMDEFCLFSRALERRGNPRAVFSQASAQPDPVAALKNELRHQQLS